LSFELAARRGFKDAAKKCQPKLLEPIMAVDVVAPDEYTDPITGELNSRRGVMRGMDTKGTSNGVRAAVQVSEMFGYITDLRTITSGRATASLSFSHYEAVPNNIAEGVIATVKGQKD